VAEGADRIEPLRLAEVFHARVIDATVSHFVFEIIGKSLKLEQFIAVMRPLGLAEICRRGVAALNRGAGAM